MKAALLKTVNQPLSIEDVPMPEPGPGQVRIHMRASGVCGTDIHVWHGLFPVELPLAIGHEPVGVVDALGAGVASLEVGDRVGVSWLQRGCGRCGECARRRERYCPTGITWANLGGGHQEYMLAEASGCTRLPEGLDWAAAAPLFCAGYTVMSGYRNARPRPGDRVGVIGIGGLGHLAIQVAKAMGHEVVAITGSANKREEARALGADEVLVVEEHAGLELLAMGGADVVLSTSNGMAQNSQVIEGLRPEGRLVTMGVGEGKIEVDPMVALTRQISVIGSMQDEREDLVDVLALAAAGKVTPKLETYPLARVNDLMERQAAGQVRYRGVLVFDA